MDGWVYIDDSSVFTLLDGYTQIAVAHVMLGLLFPPVTSSYVELRKSEHLQVSHEWDER